MDSLERPFKPDSIVSVSYSTVSSKPVVNEKPSAATKQNLTNVNSSIAMPIQDNESKIQNKAAEPENENWFR